jgi:RNA polymerase sigma factor (sigma-70 family)
MKSARTQDGSAELPAKEVLLPSCFVYADSTVPADFKNLKSKGADFMKSIKRDTQRQRESKKKYQIKVQGQLVPVSEEVYFTYHRMKRRETYLEERDTSNGVFYYSAMDTGETTGEDGIPDLISSRVEDVVMDKLITEKLHQCLDQLTDAEQELIHALFFRGISERQWATETGLHNMTIHDRKIKILAKLKKMMEK